MDRRTEPSASFVETPAGPGRAEQMRRPNAPQPLLAELSEQMRAQGSLPPALAGTPQAEDIGGPFKRLPAGTRDVRQQVEKLLAEVKAKPEESHGQIEKTTTTAPIAEPDETAYPDLPSSRNAPELPLSQNRQSARAGQTDPQRVRDRPPQTRQTPAPPKLPHTT